MGRRAGQVEDRGALARARRGDAELAREAVDPGVGVHPRRAYIAGDDDLEAIVRAAVWRKELKHRVDDPGFTPPPRSMSQIGG